MIGLTLTDMEFAAPFVWFPLISVIVTAPFNPGIATVAGLVPQRT